MHIIWRHYLRSDYLSEPATFGTETTISAPRTNKPLHAVVVIVATVIQAVVIVRAYRILSAIPSLRVERTWKWRNGRLTIIKHFFKVLHTPSDPVLLEVDGLSLAGSAVRFVKSDLQIEVLTGLIRFDVRVPLLGLAGW